MQHAILFKTVCHLVQKIQSEHMQADLRHKRNTQLLMHNCNSLIAQQQNRSRHLDFLATRERNTQLLYNFNT
jgi:hypothetical protein